MNNQTDLENVPFVNEECGDTMWDEARLDQLTESTGSQQLPFQPNQVTLPLEVQGSAKAGRLKQSTQEKESPVALKRESD